MWYSPDLPKSAVEVDSWEAPRTRHFGKGDATEMGANKTPFFQDPACTLALGSFTAFVGVALNDQTEFGRGNLCLLRGAHEEVEAFFRMQSAAGGKIGPEGPGWPRLTPRKDGGVALTPMPQSIRDKFTDGAQVTDGIVWPEPTPILLDEGDAVIALHACPHGGSINNGADPRINIYFRLRHERPGGAAVLGDSDHPDRGWEGEFPRLSRRLRPLEGRHRCHVRPLGRVGRHGGGRRPSRGRETPTHAQGLTACSSAAPPPRPRYPSEDAQRHSLYRRGSGAS